MDKFWSLGFYEVSISKVTVSTTLLTDWKTVFQKWKKCSSGVDNGHTQPVDACLTEIAPWLWCIHGRAEGTKKYIFTLFELWDKEVRSLSAAQYWYRSCLWLSLSSESSLIQSPNICSGKQILLFVYPVSATGWPCILWYSINLKRNTNSFAAVENNSMHTAQPTCTWTKHKYHQQTKLFNRTSPI